MNNASRAGNSNASSTEAENNTSDNELNDASSTTDINPEIRHSRTPLQAAMQKISQLNNTVHEQSMEIIRLREELAKEKRNQRGFK